MVEESNTSSGTISRQFMVNVRKVSMKIALLLVIKEQNWTMKKHRNASTAAGLYQTKSVGSMTPLKTL